ncbi:MAG: 2-oxo acid dehydrogenase subunit E2 [Planctomycetota bacterium]
MADIKLPELGENIDQGDVISVLVNVGDTITAEQPILEVETGKAVVEVPASTGGKIQKIHVKKGDKISVGTVVVTVEGDGIAGPEKKPSAGRSGAMPPVAAAAAAPAKAPARAAAPAVAARPAGVVHTGDPSRIPAAPHVRRIARELGLDITKVPGTGKAGRIDVEDLKAYSRELNSKRGMGVPAKALPDFKKYGAVTVEPMNTVRRLTAEGLTHAHIVIPPVTQHDKADTTDIDAYRKQHADAAAAKGAKITVTAILLKICANGLKEFPQFNSSIDLEGGNIIRKQYVHIGVAVDTPHGLLVPVIRNVDQKGIIQLAVELGEVAKKARDRKISPDMLEGGCFSISNLGGIGGTGFTPIVNWPEVAILGVSRGSVEPVWNGSEFKPRQLTPLSLSYDHRVIDGADAARFTRWVCEQLEKVSDLPL